MGLLKTRVEKLAARGDIDGLIDCLALNEDVRAKATEALVRIGEPAVAPLVDVLVNVLGPWPGLGTLTASNINDRLSPDDMRMVNRVRSVPQALGAIGEPAVDPLIAALTDQNLSPRARGFVIDALGETRSPRALAPLVHYATHECPSEVKEGAVSALAQFPEPKGFEALVNALDCGGGVAVFACDSLVKVTEAMGEPAQQRLRGVAGPGHPEGQVELSLRSIYAACALAGLGDDYSVWVLMWGFTTPNQDVRLAVVSGYYDLLAAYKQNGVNPGSEQYPELLLAQLHTISTKHFEEPVCDRARWYLSKLGAVV